MLLFASNEGSFLAVSEAILRFVADLRSSAEDLVVTSFLRLDGIEKVRCDF